MTYSSKLNIRTRFQRSISLDRDFSAPQGLDGYICIKSAQEAVANTIRQIKAGQCSFTWTGPYGSGKSSLALVFSRLVAQPKSSKDPSMKVFSKEVTKEVKKVLTPGENGWRIINIVGRREDPVVLISDLLKKQGVIKNIDYSSKDSKVILDQISKYIQNCNSDKDFGGLLVVVDEMGKILESSAIEGNDIYFFQELAELANRSNGKLVFIGILHQAIQEYAHRLSRYLRVEWMKIHGRFSDIPVSAAGEEQIELISKAIEKKEIPDSYRALAVEVSSIIKKLRPSASKSLENILQNCWPLHPLVACIMGPISKKRFGQSQRSLFAFINSSEPKGFNDFIKQPEVKGLYYTPAMYWDYLKINLEASILASSDGHRWAMTVDALDRCEIIGGNNVQFEVLKTIAILDFVKEHSISPRIEFLYSCLGQFKTQEIDSAIEQLKKWSLIIYKHHSSSYGIFAGSDFDIEQALEQSLAEIKSLDFKILKETAGTAPILAKRFYHKTGSMFWLEFDLCPLDMLEVTAKAVNFTPGTLGKLLLAIPTNNESEDIARKICEKAAINDDEFEVITGYGPRSWKMVTLSREIMALEKIYSNSPELSGDPVARREIQARLAEAQGLLETEVVRLLDGALWFRQGKGCSRKKQTELNFMASDIAEEKHPQSPFIHNELLNRIKPSSSGNGAQNALLKRMVLNENLDRLGLEGYPAEAGIYESIVKKSGIHRKTEFGIGFCAPGENDPCRLTPLWNAAKEILKSNESNLFTMAAIFEMWQKPPLGVKTGLMKILGVAFILSERENLAIYRDEVFQTRLTDLDIDYLTMDPNRIQLRWMDLSSVSKNLLAELADVVRDLSENHDLKNLAPIDVGKGLVGIYENLSSWTKRTMRLSANAVKTRLLLKQAKDPNSFLFEDLPSTYADITGNLEKKHLRAIVNSVKDGLKELKVAHENIVSRFKESMIKDLQVPNLSKQSLKELNTRAKNISGISGDFKVEAFITRLLGFDGSESHIESIMSLLCSKPAEMWIDQDIDRAELALAEACEKFLHLESFARVKGRQNKRHSIALVVGTSMSPKSHIKEFEITDAEIMEVKYFKNKFAESIANLTPEKMNVALAALTELAASIIDESTSTNKEEAENQ